MAEVTDKNANYTPEMLERMVAMYEELGNEGIEEIAETLGKTVRSIRSKLVREGVYVAAPKGVSAKTEGPSKKELLREIEAKGFDTAGFEGATKIALSRLLGLVGN
jgi:transposase-like protein